ncbi:MAG: hypothetical protein JO032_16875 [Alphaproteobacteria bacterium]|nr:hypothetical protein [Alphaproteobacteria bacterium]MBV9554457.1 hypothetical protein [Alphaproteobacteria bacterium]
MTTIGTVVNIIVLLVVLVLAGEWSFGLYGAAAGLILALIVIAVVIRLHRSAEGGHRFDPAGDNPA